MKKNICCILIYLLLISFPLCASRTRGQDKFVYKVALVGHPANPDIRYDEAQMSALKDLGFNTLQLNIAWGARPGDEPLNLEDILWLEGKSKGSRERVAERLADIQFRAREAKKWGFRTLFHFGAPNVDSLYKVLAPPVIDVVTEINSISKPEVVQRYVDLLKRLKQEVPELDDILIYTFDQDAWLANEFGDGPTDRNIPLHERVPGFIRTLTETWASMNSDGMLWWEPWEMSAGQIYACLPELPVKNFGFFLHSNIAEAQLTRPVDVWFKNMARMANERGIPVVGEVYFGSAQEEMEPLQMISAPRLVGEEIDAIHGVPYIYGIKEYYGFIPDRYDPNLQMVGLKFRDPEMTNGEALKKIAGPFGAASSDILAAWENSALGLSAFPWDCAWTFRSLPQNYAGIRVFHRWNVAHINGEVAPSPSWRSTRRSLFMTTQPEYLEPWFFEDIELRCATSAQYLQRALDFFKQARENVHEEPYAAYLSDNIRDMQKLEQIVTAIRCYCRECNLAYLMRKYTCSGEPIPQHLIERFEQIMQIDIANQEKGFTPNQTGEPSAAEMLTLFKKDPVAWVEQYLITTDWLKIGK